MADRVGIHRNERVNRRYRDMGDGTWAEVLWVAGGTGDDSGQVQGSAPDGSPALGNPVVVAGADDDGLVRTLAVDETGGALVRVYEPLPSGDNNIGNVDVASLPSLPAGTNRIGDVGVVERPVVGAHGNAWNNAAVAAGETSPTLSIAQTPFVTVFGNSGATTTITLQLSHDGINWYGGPEVTLGAATDFYINATLGVAFVRLRSSLAATITATVAAKG